MNAYSDSNFSGALDNGELSVSVGSNGSFSLSTTNQSLYNCLRNMPLAADSSSNYFFSYNPDGSSGTVILNPFVSVFSDFIYPSVFWDHPSIDGENCSTLNSIRAGILKRNSNVALRRIEKFDQLTYDDLLVDPSNPVTGNPIDDNRTADLQKFWQSIKTIEETISNEFRTTIASEYPSVALSTRSELDISNWRIFLNNSSYPNPSTDLTPVANSIDSVAVVAGMDLIASIDNYIGTWRNLLKVEVWDMHISNNGEMLIDSSDCWLNFSNLCKLEPTIQNIFQHYDTDIYDYYTKETSRGTEVVLRADFVYRDSNSCAIGNYVHISETLSNSVIEKGYSKFTEGGYFDTADLTCYAYNQDFDTMYVEEQNTNGEIITLTIVQLNGTDWDSPDNFKSIQDSNFDWDTLDDGENIEQIPAEFINAFIDLKLSWAEMKTVVDANYNNSDIGLWFEYLDRNLFRTQLLYSPYYELAVCFSPDLFADGGSWSSEDGVHTFDEVENFCLERIEFGKITDLTEDQIVNISPYRGVIDG